MGSLQGGLGRVSANKLSQLFFNRILTHQPWRKQRRLLFATFRFWQTESLGFLFLI